MNLYNSTFKRKPSTKAKTRTCKNRACRRKFTPTETHPFAIACCTGCEIILAKRHIEKAQEARERAERKALRAAKSLTKRMQDRLKETQDAVNWYVRVRDHHLGCCSCEKGPNWDGQWHASHFKSVGSNSLLRFHLWNIHKGCSECNRHQAGNIPEYRERLALKIGVDRVQWLDDNKNGSRKYTPEYLDRLKKIFRKRARRMGKRKGLRGGE